MELDIYNPYYSEENNKCKDDKKYAMKLINSQILRYCASNWYDSISDKTISLNFIKLAADDIDLITNGKWPNNLYLNQFIEFILSLAEPTIIKSELSGATNSKNCRTIEDVKMQILDGKIIRSFLRGCKYLVFSPFVDIPKAIYQVYVYNSNIEYIECIDDECELPNILFPQIISFVNEIIDSEDLNYSDFTIKIFYDIDLGEWRVIKIGLPFYLDYDLPKLINYEKNKSLIYSNEIVCRYIRDGETLQHLGNFN
jgi:hypothetical protein